jgi:hypothetical protein
MLFLHWGGSGMGLELGNQNQPWLLVIQWIIQQLQCRPSDLSTMQWNCSFYCFSFRIKSENSVPTTKAFGLQLIFVGDEIVTKSIYHYHLLMALCYQTLYTELCLPSLCQKGLLFTADVFLFFSSSETPRAAVCLAQHCWPSMLSSRFI